MKLASDPRLFVAFAVPASRGGYRAHTNIFPTSRGTTIPRAIIVDPIEGVIEEVPAQVYLRQAGYRVAPSKDLPFLQRQLVAARKRLTSANSNCEAFSAALEQVQVELSDLQDQGEEDVDAFFELQEKANGILASCQEATAEASSASIDVALWEEDIELQVAGLALLEVMLKDVKFKTKDVRRVRRL